MSEFSILAAAREAPARPALVNGGAVVTFAELAARVRERLPALAPLAERPPHSFVCLTADNTRATIELMLALMEMRVAFLPLHARFTPAEREDLRARLRPAAEVVAAAEHTQLSAVAKSPACLPPHSSVPEEAALALIMTSGSSGAAKAAVLSARAFRAAAAASAANLGWREDDRWLLCLPLAHIGGLSVLTRCLLARRALVLPASTDGVASAESVLASLSNDAVTLASVVPSQLQRWLALLPAHASLPASVRAVLTGGAACSPALLTACAERGWPVLTTYGSTEACSQIATQAPGNTNRGEQGAGRVLPGLSLKLDAGVIHLKGPTLFSGYHPPGASPFDAQGWFRSEDLGELDARGNLHVLGRADGVIISGGENVAPWEVERALESCAGVRLACVFGVPDERWGQGVAAALLLESGARAELPRIARELRERLAVFKRPRWLACLDDFVWNGTGKVDRKRTAEAAVPLLEPWGASSDG
jgi:o-succinylbenzoate---CoA ligase